MLTAANATGAIVEASTADRATKPFACPECHSEVVLKQGRIKIAHFAHKPPVDCTYGAGETELHRAAKLGIRDALRDSAYISGLALERSLGSVRPDVSFRYRLSPAHKGWPVVVEVQVSTLTLAQIEYRTEQYYHKGCSILWTPPFSTRGRMSKRVTRGKVPPFVVSTLCFLLQ